MATLSILGKTKLRGNKTDMKYSVQNIQEAVYCKALIVGMK